MADIGVLPEEILEQIFLFLSLSQLFQLEAAAKDDLLPQSWAAVASRRVERVKTCLLDSLGPAAYYEGAALGEYQLGEDGVYRQKGGGTFVLSKTEEGGWEVEHVEGYVPFVCQRDSPLPPKSGWSFRRGATIESDPLVKTTLSDRSFLQCSSITFSSTNMNSTLTPFKATESWSRGRRVFRNCQGLVLWVGTLLDDSDNDT